MRERKNVGLCYINLSVVNLRCEVSLRRDCWGNFVVAVVVVVVMMVVVVMVVVVVVVVVESTVG